MAADVLEMRLAASFAALAAADGQVHSQFASAVNLVFPLADGADRLITILPPRFSGLPDSLVVPEADFSRLAAVPAATAVRKKGLVFQLPDLGLTWDGSRTACYSSVIDLKPDDASRSDHPLSLASGLRRFMENLAIFQADGASADGFARADPAVSARIRAALDQAIRCWLTGDWVGVQAGLAGCLGWGCGLTPTADDALVGALALIEGAWLSGSQSWPWAGKRPDRAVLQLEAATRGRTTDVSRKYLLCAQEGRFADVLRRLVRATWLDQAPAWPMLLAAVAGVGSTSGMDMLAGVASASRILLAASESTTSPAGLAGQKN